ncbi:DUF3329 domain-containing protein [Martelella sp. HB161492]|uniref:DUF3329 domain-containing protein n=1 Tax=Martelella sp. HB161492 TaxID=2720726 RepID=UPI0015928CBD|nr:DUF3329 domain-containing protein [Martelella sp. HB161492]
MADDKRDWRKNFDLKHPMLKPLWLRLLLIAVCFGWAAVELTIGSRFWAGAVIAAGLYMVWVFFLSSDRHYFTRIDDEEEK